MVFSLSASTFQYFLTDNLDSSKRRSTESNAKSSMQHYAELNNKRSKVVLPSKARIRKPKKFSCHNVSRAVSTGTSWRDFGYRKSTGPMQSRMNSSKEAGNKPNAIISHKHQSTAAI